MRAPLTTLVIVSCWPSSYTGRNPGTGRGFGDDCAVCVIDGGLGSLQSDDHATTDCPNKYGGATFTPCCEAAPSLRPTSMPSAVIHTLEPTRRLPTPVRTPHS